MKKEYNAVRIEERIVKEKSRPRVAVHKFTSCDGCQLAFLNLGEDLLALSNLVDIVHFSEAGMISNDAIVDIAFVEGSITTEGEQKRISKIRKNSSYLITLGACASAGGIQALRNIGDSSKWVSEIYPDSQYINTLGKSTPISNYVRVDFELFGCPVNARQVVASVRSLLYGVKPLLQFDKVCIECKRQQVVCTIVSKGTACMGPVTRTGCGAICPKMGRDCYACFGPGENINTESLAKLFSKNGLNATQVANKFLFINNSASDFNATGLRWLKQ